MYARYETGKHKEAVAAAQKIWRTFESGEALQFEFFDDTFNKTLERENQTRIIIISFTIISLIITAIGLAGLIGHKQAGNSDPQSIGIYRWADSDDVWKKVHHIAFRWLRLIHTRDPLVI